MSVPTQVDHAAVPDNLVELGRILSAHGVRGWIKIQPHSTQADTLLKARVWWLQAPVAPAGTGALSRPAQRKVLHCRRHGATLIAQLEGLDDRDEAQALKGYGISVPRSDFVSPEADEYYWVDLIGCWLYGVDDAQAPVLLGKVSEVSDNGAHAILHVARYLSSGVDDPSAAPEAVLDAKGRAVELLVPFVSAHVHDVDLAQRRILSSWPIDL